MTNHNDTELFCADFVLPITASPIANGCVAVANGRIADVGREQVVARRYPSAPVRRFEGVLMPGLVNAHTHLQFTTFANMGQTPFVDYTAWAIRFVDEYEARPHEDWAAACEAGIRLSLEAGVTCIADVVTDFSARDVLYHHAVPGIAYLELIGLDLAEWESGAGEALRQAVAAAPSTEVNSVGISPHAPYSLELPVLSAMADLARELDVRIHSHVAESDGEDEFYRSGTGSLAERVRSVASRPVAILEQAGVGMGAAELVASVGLLGLDAHLAHGVYLGQQGRALVAGTGSLVALCPRSNTIVGVDPPPIAAYLEEDVPFAVGTDSLSSSPSLDPLDDVAFLKALALEQGADPAGLDRRLLHAATSAGAHALGLQEHLGSLDVGKRADLAVFDVGPVTERTVETAMVETGAGSCVATFIEGRERWSSQPVSTDKQQ